MHMVTISSKSEVFEFSVGWGGGWVAETPMRGVGLHLTCDAHFRTWSSYLSQKSLGLVEAFKSYRGNIQKK